MFVRPGWQMTDQTNLTDRQRDKQTGENLYRIQKNVCKARLADDRPAKVTDRQRENMYRIQ